jgi:hypothetical protein
MGHRFQVWAQDSNGCGGQLSPYQVDATATLSDALRALENVAGAVAYGWVHWE